MLFATTAGAAAAVLKMDAQEVLIGGSLVVLAVKAGATRAKSQKRHLVSKDE